MKITNRIATEDYVTIVTGEKITSPFTGLVGQTIVVKEIDENGRPVKWECVDISSGGNSGSGLPKHIQSDWNENNPNAEGYIANRTHWSETNRDTIIEEINRTSAYGFGESWQWDIDIEQPNLVVGETYAVVIGDYSHNSAECICTCFEYTNEYDETSIVIGNPSIIDGEDGTGEPFYIYSHDENDYGIVTNDDVLSIAVYHVVETVHKIDAKYLPDSTSSKSELVAKDDDNGNVELSSSPNDLIVDDDGNGNIILSDFSSYENERLDELEKKVADLLSNG